MTITKSHTHLLCLTTTASSFRLSTLNISYPPTLSALYHPQTGAQSQGCTWFVIYNPLYSPSSSYTFPHTGTYMNTHTCNTLHPLWGKRSRAHPCPAPFSPAHPNSSWHSVAAGPWPLRGCNHTLLVRRGGSDFWCLLSDKPATCHQLGSL